MNNYDYNKELYSEVLRRDQELIDHFFKSSLCGDLKFPEPVTSDLNNGIKVCEKCNGQRLIVNSSTVMYNQLERCDICDGQGTLTWTEKIFGKEPTPYGLLQNRNFRQNCLLGILTYNYQTLNGLIFDNYLEFEIDIMITDRLTGKQVRFGRNY